MAAEFHQLQRELGVYRGLVEVSALINGITESEELLPAVLDVARRVMNAEAASLFLLTPDGNLQLAVVSVEKGESGIPPQRILVPRGRGISGWVLEHGQPLLVPNAYEDPRFYREADKATGFHTRSILCVPLVRNGKEIGVLQVLNPVGRDSFDAPDLAAFSAYGNLAATAIDKLRMIERRREQQRIDHELGIARDIQSSFLPQDLPETPNAQFAATYRPATQVGGDFFDVIEMGEDRFYFVIGDVSGKGMPAALLMAQSLSTLRLILQPNIAPATVLSRWNEMLCGRTIRGMFITAIVGRLDAKLRTVEFASAGHCHPVLVREGGETEEIAVNGAPPLGIIPGRVMVGHTVSLQPGEWLVHYTDGLIESFNEDNVPLDLSGMRRLLNRKFDSAKQLVSVLEEGELAHRGAADPHDDLTILTLGCR
jgi:phosphoserine phosphatase RsbU/P